MRDRAPHRRHAAKVAAAAAAVVVACYVVGALSLNLVMEHRLTAEADGRIAAKLADAGQLTIEAPSATTSAGVQFDGDLDDAPIFVWEVGPSGIAKALTAGAPALPRRHWAGAPVTLTVRTTPFRFDVTKSGSTSFVAGQSVAEIARVRSVLLLPEVVFGVGLALAAFAGALVIGLRASAPLELIRRRQAEFTADASHELRTPLTVVEAEVDLALQRTRTPAEYEAVLRRIAGEGRRLRRIVDDLLWLARADGGPVETDAVERADVAASVAACTERFQAVAQRLGVTLTYEGEGGPGCVVQAAPEWIDRLAGVLIDNACKYAGSGGRVQVHVQSAGNRVGLLVDDDGPGIPPEERAAVLDRFHRATAEPGGAGLGLAIADSVVRMTNGTWDIGRAPIGGARMEIWWRRAFERRGAAGTRHDAAAEHPLVVASGAPGGSDREVPFGA